MYSGMGRLNKTTREEPGESDGAKKMRGLMREIARERDNETLHTRKACKRILTDKIP